MSGSGCRSCRGRRCGSRGPLVHGVGIRADLLECKHRMSILSTRRAALKRPLPMDIALIRRDMKFARLGPSGAEIPVLIEGEEYLDLRPVTSDVNGDFLAGDFRAR